MSATERANPQAQTAAAEAGEGGQPSNPIVSALHQMAASLLGEQLRQMFEKADDILFDSAEKARVGDEQRLYLDTMRIIRVQRSRILKAFEEALQHALGQIPTDGSGSSAGADLDDMSKWSLQDGDALEERLAVSNMETKAATLHSHELVELQRRLTRLADLSGGEVTAEAMSPGRIIRAFQTSMREVSVDFPIKLVIYKLFDRVVVGRLSEVFVGANQLLAVHGIEPTAPPEPRKPKPGAVPTPPPVAGMPSGTSPMAADASSPPPAWAAGLDASVFASYLGDRALQAQGIPAFGGPVPSGPWGAAPLPGLPSGLPSFPGGGYPMTAAAGFGAAAQGMPPLIPGALPAGASYTDALLAQDVSQILGAYAQGKRPAQAPAWLPPENVALVARMFDGYYRDPRLNDRMKPALSRLQMPIMKAALADPKFFSDPQHPARRVANDLFEMLVQFSSVESAPAPRMLDDLQGLVEATVQAFQLDPSKLRNGQARPVDERTAGDFLREQDEQRQQQNRSRLERVRRIVAHEVRVRIGERKLPSGVMRLMLAGFGPLLCLDFIRSGVEGESWTQTMGLLERVLRSLDGVGAASAQERAAEEAEVVAAISRRLTSIGFAEDKLQEIISGLLQAYLERAEQASQTFTPPPDLVVKGKATSTLLSTLAATRTAPASESAAAPLSPERELAGLLSIVLIPGAWFTVWDSGEQKRHWMRVRAYYPSQNLVLFAHYMDERYFRLRATAFATDLIDGRSAAIDPAPELQQAIARMSAARFPHESDPVIWVNADGQPLAG
ncbi:MAG TPA: DUF1631 family protein [Solimonas sp.]|nr:DUF1631 family protein [Solimonas sp.]